MEKRAFSVLGWGLIAGFAAIYAVTLIVEVPVLLAGTTFSDNMYMVLSGLASAAALGALWLVVRRLPKETMTKTKMTVGQFFATLSVVMGATYLFNILGMMVNELITYLLTGTSDFLNPVSEMVDDVSWWAILLFTCIVAPVVEELMFRKILLERLMPFGEKIAILCSGIAFGLYHMNLSQIPYATAIGIILAFVVAKTGNVLHGILLHAGTNALGALLPTILERWSENAANTALTVLLIASIGLGIVFFSANIRRVRLAPARYRFSRPVNAGVVLGNAGAICYLAVCLIMTLLSVFLYAA